MTDPTRPGEDWARAHDTAIANGEDQWWAKRLESSPAHVIAGRLTTDPGFPAIAHALQVERDERLGPLVEDGASRLLVGDLMGEELQMMWEDRNLDSHPDPVGVIGDLAGRGQLGDELYAARLQHSTVTDEPTSPAEGRTTAELIDALPDPAPAPALPPVPPPPAPTVAM